MTIFSAESFSDHEQVVFVSDAPTGLRAIIAIHDTTLGPALGGCRMYPYADEAAALRDVLRLSRGMTFKAAAAGLNLGGGKAVILGDPKRGKSPALMRAMGHAVERLGGRYITAEDVSTTVADFAWVREATAHVVGLPVDLGGTSDPSPTTALGVFHGLVAAAQYRWGADDLAGRTVAVQGLGNVGWHLCRLLTEAGARVVVADTDGPRAQEAAKAFQASVVDPDDIYGVDADIFAPCALGAIVNDETLPAMRFAIIAGAANNQLAHDAHGEQLRARGILYAPDFVINAAGMMRVASEREGFDATVVDVQVRGIGESLRSIFSRAERDGVPSSLQPCSSRRSGSPPGGSEEAWRPDRPAMDTIEILRTLVAFDTTSHRSNLDLIGWVASYLDGHGIQARWTHSDDRAKANLLATIGPNVAGGIVLSGHTDMVPVADQAWDSHPFTLVEREGVFMGGDRRI